MKGRSTWTVSALARTMLVSASGMPTAVAARSLVILATVPSGGGGFIAVEDECIYWSNALGIFSLAKTAEGPFAPRLPPARVIGPHSKPEVSQGRLERTRMAIALDEAVQRRPTKMGSPVYSDGSGGKT